VDWDEVASEVAGISPGAFLATTGADGRPHLAWVSLGHRDRELVVFTYRTSRKGRNLLDGNGHVALHWPEGSHAQVFVRARARVVDDAAERHALWDAQLMPYDAAGFFGTADNPQLLMVVLTPVYASVQRALGQPPATWRAAIEGEDG
jgi:general stress protein 26